MNPNRGEAAGGEFEAPQVPVEGIDRVQEKAQESPQTQESTPGSQAPPATPVLPQDMPVAQPVSLPPAQDDSPAAGSVQTSHIHDSDRIERQWIDRAKTIISQTRSDPYKQKHEMSKVKADYIQKRFNKPIKTDTEA